MVGAIVVAAGSGRRFGGSKPKQFVELGGLPLVGWSVRALADHPAVDRVVVALPGEMRDGSRGVPAGERGDGVEGVSVAASARRTGRDAVGASAPVGASPVVARTERTPGWLPEGAVTVAGGKTRAGSVQAGLAALTDMGGVETVLVHDGARPFLSPDLVSRVVEAARGGPAIPAVGVADTVKRVDGRGFVVETLARERLRCVQTPQGFPIDVLVEAHAALAEAGGPGGGGRLRPGGQEGAGGRGEEALEEQDGLAGVTDDAVLCERLGIDVATIEGDPANLKITTPSDIAFAEWLIDTGFVPGRSFAGGRSCS